MRNTQRPTHLTHTIKSPTDRTHKHVYGLRRKAHKQGYHLKRAKRAACSEAPKRSERPAPKRSESRRRKAQRPTHLTHTHIKSPTDGTHKHVYCLRRKAHRQGCHSGPENCVSTQLVLLTRGPVKAKDVQKRVLLTRVPSRQRATPNCCTTQFAHPIVPSNYINNQENAGDWANFFYSLTFGFPYQFLQGFRRLG